MTYDPADITLSSILIDGVDTRQAFGLEALTIGGRGEMNFERKDYKLPQRNGIVTQGGNYRERKITISGWIPKENVRRFARFLFQDMSSPSAAKRRRSITFMDDPTVSYVFDSVESFVESEMTRRWRVFDACEVSFTIRATSAFGYQGISEFGITGDLKYSQGAGGVSVNGASFLSIYPNIPNRDAASHEGLTLRIGSATDPQIASCKTGVITDFNSGMKAKNILGEQIDAKLYGGTELLTNGNFASTSGGWTGIGSPNFVSAQPSALTSESLTTRMPTGSHIGRIDTASSSSGIKQAIACTSGKMYVVRFEFMIVGGTGDIRVEWGQDAIGQTLIRHSYDAVTNFGIWNCCEFLAPAEASVNYALRLYAVNSGVEVILNRATIVESGLLNGSFEGTYSGGVAPNWSNSGFTATEETSIVFSKGTADTRKAQRLSYNASGNYFEPSSAVTIGTGKLAYICGRVYRVSGLGKLKITNASSPSPYKRHFVEDTIELTTGAWVRFSLIAAYDSGLDFLPRFQLTEASTVILDDFAVYEMGAVSETYFEPGPYGKRLQVPKGQAVLIKDFVNAFSFTAVCHFLPSFQGMGAEQIFRAYHEGIWDTGVVLRKQTGATNVLTQLIATDGTSWYAPSTVAIALHPFYGGARGTWGIALKYDGIGALDNSDYASLLFAERKYLPSNPLRGTLMNAIEGEARLVPGAYPVARSVYNRIILGDIGHWDGFWIYQYGMTNEQAAAECCAMDLPAFENRVMQYNGTINTTEVVIIDLESGTAELWNGTTLTNAMPNITGDIPSLDGEFPVLFIADEIANVQVIGKSLT